ncbi:MAG TPA: potassium channel family protein [Ilumatobacteraceae bacterium]|nr:potassium channel family protein [Ilumatobacteraceae bacterium]
MARPDDAPLAITRLRDMRRREVTLAVTVAIVRAVLGASLLVTAYYVLPIDTTKASGIAVRASIALLLIVVVLLWQIREIERSSMPMLRAVDALAVAVTLMVVLFAAAYVTMSALEPRSFNEQLGRTDALYFTMTTLATVGFGDIHAVTNGARIVVMIQMVFNVVVIGLGVKLISATARRRMETDHTP